MNTETSFYLTLPSNSSDATYTKNKTQSYRVQLARSLQLEGDWEVALTEIQYPHNWVTIDESSTFIMSIGRFDDKGKNKNAEDIERLDEIPETSTLSIDEINIRLPAGYYANAEDIYEQMISSAKESFASVNQEGYVDLPLSFKINNNTQKGKLISSKKASLLYNTKGTKHAIALGLEIPESRPNEIPYYSFPVRSKNPFSVHQPTLYVYSDLVRHQLVGDALVPLLRIVPTSGKLGEYIMQTFTRPYYVPVSKGYINSVEIQINNDTGKPVNFLSGKVVCVLHLRKCGL